jgi:hypothetical protein
VQDIKIKGDLHEAEDPEEDLIIISHRKVSRRVTLITKVTNLIEDMAVALEVGIVIAAVDTTLSDGEEAVGHMAEAMTQLIAAIFSRKTW